MRVIGFSPDGHVFAFEQYTTLYEDEAAFSELFFIDTRRDVFLVFKEAVNNAARHAACSRVEVELQAERGRLRLRVADDGRGLDAAALGEGHGLPSMRRRARGLKGTLEVAPRPGGGTCVLLEVPSTSGPTLRG